MSKGSKRRPRAVSYERYAANWDAAFGTLEDDRRNAHNPSRLPQPESSPAQDDAPPTTRNDSRPPPTP